MSWGSSRWAFDFPDPQMQTRLLHLLRSDAMAMWHRLSVHRVGRFHLSGSASAKSPQEIFLFQIKTGTGGCSHSADLLEKSKIVRGGTRYCYPLNEHVNSLSGSDQEVHLTQRWVSQQTSRCCCKQTGKVWTSHLNAFCHQYLTFMSPSLSWTLNMELPTS